MDNFDHTIQKALTARVCPAWFVRRDVPCQGAAVMADSTNTRRDFVRRGAR